MMSKVRIWYVFLDICEHPANAVAGRATSQRQGNDRAPVLDNISLVTKDGLLTWSQRAFTLFFYRCVWGCRAAFHSDSNHTQPRP